MLDVSAYNPIGIYNKKTVRNKDGTITEDKSVYYKSDSNFLDDVYVVIVDNLNDSVITSDILGRNDDKAVVDFMRANGFPLNKYNYQDFLIVRYHIFRNLYCLYWYGEYFNKYLTNTQLDFGGKLFTQYSAYQVLPQYDELFNLDNHTQKQHLDMIQPESESIVNAAKNRYYGWGGISSGHDYVAFLSIGWACKMTKSEYESWKPYCNAVHTEYAYQLLKNAKCAVADVVWEEGLGRYDGHFNIYRTAVINGTLLR